MQHYNNKLFIIVVIKVAVYSLGANSFFADREGLVKVSTMTKRISGSFEAFSELGIDQDDISGS